MPGAGEPWDELDHRERLSQFPLDGQSPSGPGAAALAHQLGRTLGAVQAQWNDAFTYCPGRDSSVASDQLKSYLDRNGLSRTIR